MLSARLRISGSKAKGVFWSTDDGDSWLQDNSGLPPHWVWSLVVSPAGFVFAGTDSGGIFRTIQPVTAVESQRPSLPTSFVLGQNYPNPFNPSTTIRYGLPSRSQVTLAVYNTLGQQVATLVEGEQESGYHEVQFDASGLASGVYMYRLQAGDFVQSLKLTLLR